MPKKHLIYIPLKNGTKKVTIENNIASLSKKDILNLLNLKDAMLTINQFILEFKDIEALFSLILDKVMNVMDHADFGSVLLLNDQQELTMAVCRGYGDDYKQSFRIPIHETFFWKQSVGNITSSQIINDIHYELWDKHTRDFKKSASKIIQSSISTPIIIKGNLYGLINIDSTENRVFKSFESEVLEYLKNQLEIGINNHILYEKNVYLSRYDSLTNIYNRRYFEELFENCLQDAQYNHNQFHVVMMDINRLKQVNDYCGHLAGDQLIKTFSEYISNIVDNKDVFARLAGDEFAIISTDKGIFEINSLLVQTLNYFKDHPFSFENYRLICSFSFGISSYPDDGTDYNQLLKVADNRMYIHKRTMEAPNPFSMHS